MVTLNTADVEAFTANPMLAEEIRSELCDDRAEDRDAGDQLTKTFL